MAIDDRFDPSSTVSSTPSMVEVITKKGWRIGGTPTGRWEPTNGLIHLSTEDINDNSTGGPNRTPPYSLYSFKGYNHFYNVWPIGCKQNEKGRPENYLTYSNMITDITNTAFNDEIIFPWRADTKSFLFNQFPLTYKFCNPENTITTPNGNWLGMTFSPDKGQINLTAKENNSGVVRKGYISVIYGVGTAGRRDFGFYVTQSMHTGLEPGDPERPGVIYKEFKVYSSLTQNGTNSGNNPLILPAQGTWDLIIGGDDLLTELTITGGEPGGIVIENIQKYTEKEFTGAVGIVTLTRKTTSTPHVLEITVANTRSRFTLYVGFAS